MEKELIQINKNDLIKAYKESSNDGKNTLESLFGEELFKPKDITEHIKTFEDAVNELGESHTFVVAYKKIQGLIDGLVWAENMKDVIAYLKLRIITAALNEGWEPQFTEDEWRYYPWFVLYTQKEIDEMDEEQKSRVVYRSGSSASAGGGVACAHTGSGSSYTYAHIGSRLAFKSSELAKYAGEQFTEIWADYVFKATNSKR